MTRSDAGRLGAGTVPVATKPPPPVAEAAHEGRPGRRLRVLAAWAGIVGPVMVAAYFTMPALVKMPAVGAPAGELITFANAHKALFYLGGWLQGTGALLSIAFILVLLQLSGARRTLAGSATLVGCAVLVSVVAIEAALLEAVPMAAANGDHATVATTYALATGGVFARIYPLGAAPLVFAGIGFALSGTAILPRIFARSALLIAGLFLVAGFVSAFGTAGLILAIVMSVAQAVWIAAAAIAFARSTARTQ